MTRVLTFCDRCLEPAPETTAINVSLHRGSYLMRRDQVSWNGSLCTKCNCEFENLLTTASQWLRRSPQSDPNSDFKPKVTVDAKALPERVHD